MSTSIPPSRSTILLVEDEEPTRRALRGWLERDYDVISAADGLEALEALARYGRPPELILADVWMPRLDGVEMIRRVRQDPALHRVPVIFLTGQVSPQSMIDGLSVGARAYLTKPIDLDVLDWKVRRALTDPHGLLSIPPPRARRCRPMRALRPLRHLGAPLPTDGAGRSARIDAAEASP